MAEFTIDSQAFWNRTQKLHALWHAKQDSFSNAKCLCVAVGKYDEKLDNKVQIIALQLHLFGLEFPETIFVFFPNKLLIASGGKRCDVLKGILVQKPPQSVDVEFIICQYKDEAQVKSTISNIISRIVEFCPDDAVGILKKDEELISGSFSKNFLASLKAEPKLKVVDMEAGISKFLALKDNQSSSEAANEDEKEEGESGSDDDEHAESDKENEENSEENRKKWADKLRYGKGQVQTVSEVREKQQREIFLKNQRETENRKRTREESKQDYSTAGRLGRGEICSYENEAEIPEKHKSEKRLVLDGSKETILIPIGNVAVPFHLSTLKSVSCNTEGELTFLRFNFFVPSGGATAYIPGLLFPQASFVKELTYRCRSAGYADKAVSEVQAAIKRIKQNEQMRKEMQGVVRQDAVIVDRSVAVPKLKDVLLRPSPRNKKTPGYLEAHVNGLRFTFGGGFVDILYANIKHAIFQPADKEVVVVLHFHLKNPINIGTKKHTDMQFYAEVMEEHERITGSNTRQGDEDQELEEEERQQNFVKTLNTEFLLFVKKVEPIMKGKFEQPIRHKEFSGTVSSRNNVVVRKTPNCLIALIETPFFVLSVQSVELCVLERVILGQKNFDMIFVLKDYNLPVQRIDTVEMKRLDEMKDWLTEKQIKYYECRQSMAWPQIMKEVIKDDQAGAWKPWSSNPREGWASFLDMNAENSSSDDDDSEDEDSQFHPEDTESEDEDEEWTADSEEDSDDEDDGDGEEGEEEDDPGLTWDEIEAEAAREDARQHRPDGGSSDDDDDSEGGRRPKRSKKAPPTGARPPPPPQHRPKPAAKPPAGIPRKKF